MTHLYLDAGSLRHWLTLQENNQTGDGSGGFEDGWTTLSKCWAGITPAQPGMVIRAEINSADYTHNIDVRQPNSAAMAMRFVNHEGSRIFTVLAAYDPDETGRYLRCICRQETASQ